MDREEEKTGKQQETTEPKGENRTEVKKYKVGITVKGFEELQNFLAKINKDALRLINAPEVLAQAVSKLDESDICIIRERSYSGKDKLKLLLREINQTSTNTPLSEEELLAHLVDVHKDRLKLGTKAPLKPGKTHAEEKKCS